MSDPGKLSAFFYGTLMHPAVLSRVTGNPDHVYIPAILHDYIRSRVTGADYPGLISRTSESVRGMLVQNLTANDMHRLDLFEGDEYARRSVNVRGIENNKEYACEVYVYLNEHNLEEKEWSFTDFEREKLQFWTGKMGESEYEMLQDGTNGRINFT